MNVSVLKEIGTTLSLQQAVSTRKLQYAGHALIKPRTTLMKTVCEGKLEGKRNRGRPPASLVSNLVTVSGISLHKLVGASEDRLRWTEEDCQCCIKAAPAASIATTTPAAAATAAVVVVVEVVVVVVVVVVLVVAPV
ncbi:endonuclease-reverse transcriptase [Elysia marginata]|uniref:Endonuclease-reverse transcriptase n=1 Tax=Elysia marginata TaxID=1093978 RepID=A0AAV4HEX2_9GAST|nr:endonuclease-reverse transcriptase [Elysia marginata]